MWEDLIVAGVVVSPIIVLMIALVVAIVKRIWGEKGEAFAKKWARLGCLILAMLFWGLGGWVEMHPGAMPVVAQILSLLVGSAELLKPYLPPVTALLASTGLYHLAKSPLNGVGR